MNAKRYSQDGDRDNPMKEDMDGDYVLASDYDALRSVVKVDDAMVRRLLKGLFPYGYDERWVETATSALAAALRRVDF